MLKAINIQKAYKDLQVLKGIDLEVKQSEVVSIVGASGAGKSTLLHILGTLDTADAGTVLIDGKDITAMRDTEIARFRNTSIGFIFQFHNLLPEFSALENVSLPGFIGNRSQREVDERAKYLLELLGLKDRINHKPSELSGGEQQRVSVARALLNEPKIIFADEPSGNLDSRNAEDLHRLFFQLRDEFKHTFVIVTHNEDLAQMADRTIEMKDGFIVAN